ncbi:hypothetical protein Tco_0360545 [Tanacetum coccineum]
MVNETSDVQSPAKRSKACKVTKKRIPKSPLKLINEPSNEGVRVEEQPQPAPTKPKEKKRKQAKETTEATPPAKRAKAGKGIPLTETWFGDLEADTQRAIEESLKDAHGAHRGPLPPVVFKNLNTGKVSTHPEENLKLTVDDPVIPEDPASSTGTLSSL